MLYVGVGIAAATTSSGYIYKVLMMCQRKHTKLAEVEHEKK